MRRSPFSNLALALALGLISTAAAMAGSGPKAVVPEPVKDFEIIPKGETLTHSFEIRNEGDAVLEISDVSPACGCTVAEFDRKIAPGKSGSIRATVDTGNFDGPISKSIAVFTNDAENPKMQLVIRGDVRPYIFSYPGYARYIYVQGENIVPISQTLWTEDGSNINVVGVQAPYDYLKASYHEAGVGERRGDHPGKQWRVDVVLDPNAPVGPLTEYVEVRVDHPKQKLVRIPISGFVRPRQHVTPSKVDFGTVDGDALPLQRTLTFTNFITDGIAVGDIETGVEGMTAAFEEVGDKDGHRFKLVLTVGPDMPKGEFESTLRIHISDKKNPVVEVPLKGTIL